MTTLPLKSLVCWLALLCLPATGFAQTAYSLQQALDFGLKNAVSVRNAVLDTKSAEYRVGEIRASGLPQANVSLQYQHYGDIQRNISENGSFFTDPTRPIGYPTSFAFGLNNSLIVGGTISQMIFNGSYFVGLQAAKTYKELAQKNLTASKITVAENISKAYYGVLVNEERIALLKANVARLDSLLYQTKQQNLNGFVEQIDVDRIEVQYNNIKVEAEKTERLVALSYELLKFQMNVPMSEKITLSDKLIDMTEATFTPVNADAFDYNNRIEYTTLQVNKQLTLLDIKNSRASRLPSLNATASAGFNPSSSSGKDLFDFDKRWLFYNSIGFALNIPVFDGFATRFKVRQKRVDVEKLDNSLELTRQSVDLQIKQANINLTNALESLKIQQRNRELAEKVQKVSKIKYQEGVGSNIEVINAETSLKESQTNYFAALYDALIAKVDLDKATGKLAAGK